MTASLQSQAALKAALTGAPPIGVVFPNTGLGVQLQQIAEIIQVRSMLKATRQIFFCTLGPFDTHSGQLSIHGQLLQELSEAVDAFYKATVALDVDTQVTTFTASDFNRTFQPNSNAGSDHAWGGHHLVVGGAVRGGELYGTFPDFVLDNGDDAYNQGIWIPTIATDQYAATLASWFGLSASDLTSAFGNLAHFKTSNLGFMA
jgi:uncharacterized protein (DUF1501 family)